MTPESFFKCLSDATRLRCLMLLQGRDPVCVCDIAEALESSQPKVSRHLAQLRGCGLVTDERRGQWVYYGINPSLAEWQLAVLDTVAAAVTTDKRFQQDAKRLQKACCRMQRAC